MQLPQIRMQTSKAVPRLQPIQAPNFYLEAKPYNQHIRDNDQRVLTQITGQP
jgi:hypothetical protein